MNRVRPMVASLKLEEDSVPRFDGNEQRYGLIEVGCSL